MCGIAGIFNLNKSPIEDDALKTFTDSLAHRGPDGSGYYLDKDKYFGMGHRRLSILDLSDAGKQPMSFANERYWLSYNGEIFNFLEIRSELKAKGFQFKSDSDSEVLLVAFHCWGKDALVKLNGMWAFAIWDSHDKTLFLARDRFGIKPLYYLYEPNDIFAFASETIAFKYLQGHSRQFNEKNVSLQIKDSNVLEGLGHTLFKNTYQLLPGHHLTIKADGLCQQKRWWSTLSQIKKIKEPYTEQVTTFRDLLMDSLKLRLRSDVPVATALSGGVDSSAVFCSLNHMMSHAKNKDRIPENWQQAFVATFPGTLSDEREFAEEVLNFTKSKGTYLTLQTKGIAEKIITTTLQSDSITGSPLISAYMIYEGMKKGGFSVSMDGHGVDEMLYGYPWLVRAAFNQYRNEANSLQMGDIRQTYVDLFYEDKKEEMGLGFSPVATATKWGGLKSIVKQSPFHRIYNTLKNGTQHPSLKQLSDKPYNAGNLSTAEQTIFDCFHISTLPTILKNFDRASMQNSVEVRMPFMDWRLVSYVFSLPLTSKVGHGFTKRILRDAMKDIMPETIRTRKVKVGLMAPMYDWFNNDLNEFILDEVHSQAFINSGLWDGRTLAELVTEKTRSKSWEGIECSEFWTVLNAHLLMKTH
jgi:asparagine synthase (glutamine-hydrolysing)